MNVNTNSYTVGFACAMVVIVAALLASMSIQLTPLQDRNIELEKKQNILQSVGVYVDRESSEASYTQYIKEELVLDNQGNKNNKTYFFRDIQFFTCINIYFIYLCLYKNSILDVINILIIF